MEREVTLTSLFFVFIVAAVLVALYFVFGDVKELWDKCDPNFKLLSLAVFFGTILQGGKND